MHSLYMQRDMPELVYKQGMLLLNFLSQSSINAICSIHIKTCNNFRKQCQQMLVSVGEVHETWKHSKGNGLNEVTSYRTIHVDRLRRLELQNMACYYSAVTISCFFHGFLKERQGKARKPGDHRLKEVLVLVYLFNTRDGNVFIKTSLASFLK